MSGAIRESDQKTSIAVRRKTHKRVVENRVADGEVLDSVVNRALDALTVLQRLERADPQLVATARKEAVAA